MGKTLLRQLQLTGSGEGKYTDYVGGSNVAASFGLPMQSGASLLEDLNNMRAVLTDIKGDRWYLSQSQVTGSAGAQAAPTFKELATHINASAVSSFKFLNDVVIQGTTPKSGRWPGSGEGSLWWSRCDRFCPYLMNTTWIFFDLAYCRLRAQLSYQER